MIRSVWSQYLLSNVQLRSEKQHLGMKFNALNPSFDWTELVVYFSWTTAYLSSKYKLSFKHQCYWHGSTGRFSTPLKHLWDWLLYVTIDFILIALVMFQGNRSVILSVTLKLKLIFRKNDNQGIYYIHVAQNKSLAACFSEIQICRVSMFLLCYIAYLRIS
jgi:hypothetical protein